MTAPIFRDDSTPDDKRAAATQRLLTMCPAPFRVAMQPLVEHAVSQASDDEIASLMIDVGEIQRLAEGGNVEGIATIAKRYGATDDQVATYLPMLQS